MAPTLSGVKRIVNVALPPAAIGPEGVKAPKVNCPGLVPPRESPVSDNDAEPVLFTVIVIGDEPTLIAAFPNARGPLAAWLLLNAPPESDTVIVVGMLVTALPVTLIRNGVAALLAL